MEKKKCAFLFISVISFFLLPKKISISFWKHWLFFLYVVSLCECSSAVELVPCFSAIEFSQTFGDSQQWAYLCQLPGPSSVWECGFCSLWLPSCLWWRNGVWAVGRVSLSWSAGCENAFSPGCCLPPGTLGTVSNPGSSSAGKCSSMLDEQLEANPPLSDSSAEEGVIKQINTGLRT